MVHRIERESARPRIEAPGTAEQRVLRELCHDLTVPAASINLLTQVAAAESDPNPSTRARLRQIAGEVRRILDICGYFLDQPRDGGPTDLPAVAADAARSAGWRYPGVIDVAAQEVTVAADPVAVDRILANLVDNACRAAGPGGRVLLTVRRDGGQARLVVADSGRGFGHGESGKASLGLDIVTAMVRRSGGALRMGPSDLGGLAVTVTLPVAADAGPSESESPQAAWAEEAG